MNIDPATLIVPPGQGFVPISDAGLQGSFDGVDQAISGALGIPIDGSILLQRLALAGLVDGVGGITIDSQNLYRVSESGEAAQYVRPGSAVLTGEMLLATRWLSRNSKPPMSSCRELIKFCERYLKINKVMKLG